ncbi:MAG: ROK family protein [Pseudomonadota bacterium]
MTATTTLVADVGGTNIRLALCKNGVLDADTVERFANDSLSSIAEGLSKYIALKAPTAIEAVAVAVAGPVSDGEGRLTNREWSISQEELRAITKADVAFVINDLQSQAYGIQALSPSDVSWVRGRAPLKTNKTQLVINVGTGFNIAPIFQTSPNQLVAASEAGHISLPVATSQDLALSTALKKAHGFATIEDVLSGRGVEQVFQWLNKGEVEGQSLSGRDVLEAAQRNEPLARETVGIMVRCFATVAGDFCLSHLPFGGVYLVGGVARALVPYFENHDFEKHFTDKGRFSEFLTDFPIGLVKNDIAGLYGACAFLSQQTKITA